MSRPLMTCHELIEFLDRYVEGELSDLERAEFDRHLALCPSCVAYLGGYQRSIGLARESGGVEAEAEADLPEALVRAVLAARRRGAH